MRLGKKFIAAFAVSAAALTSVAAQAAVLIEFKQVSGNVVATTSGSLDLTGLTPNGNWGLSRFVRPQLGIISAGGLGTEYIGVTGPSSFGPGGFLLGTSTTGGPVTLFGYTGVVAVPVGYVSGSALSGTVTFTGATFASLGLTPGSYVYTAPHDTLTVKITTPAVPEPATWGMMLLGTGAIGAALRRRRATQVRYAA